MREMVKCPKCGGEMKTCCQLALERAEKEGKIPVHSCGQAELICTACGHKQYDNRPLNFNLVFQMQSNGRVEA